MVQWARFRDISRPWGCLNLVVVVYYLGSPEGFMQFAIDLILLFVKITTLGVRDVRS